MENRSIQLNTEAADHRELVRADLKRLGYHVEELSDVEMEQIHRRSYGDMLTEQRLQRRFRKHLPV